MTAAPAAEVATRGGLVAAGLAAMTVERNIPFGVAGGRTQKLDVFRPAGTPPPAGWPVVVAIHGGGWRKFDKSEYEPTVLPLVRNGYEVVAPNYPLSAPSRATWPQNYEAVQASVRWVKVHAASIQADPTRIAAMGESAGGHLAALLGTAPDLGADPSETVSPRVAAVVDFFGPTDLAALAAASSAAGPIRQFLGATPPQDPALARSASPITYVAAGNAPFLIVQGLNDPVVVPQQSESLAQALSAAGVSNRLIEIPRASHGFGLTVRGRSLLPDVLDFLARSMPARPSLPSGKIAISTI